MRPLVGKLGLKVGQSLLKAARLRLNQYKSYLGLYLGHTRFNQSKRHQRMCRLGFAATVCDGWKGVSHSVSTMRYIPFTAS